MTGPAVRGAVAVSRSREVRRAFDARLRVANEGGFEGVADRVGTGRAAGVGDAPHRIRVEGNVDGLVDGREHVGYLVAVGDDDHAGDERALFSNALGEAAELPARLDRVVAGAVRRRGLAPPRGDAEGSQGADDGGRSGLVPRVEAAPGVVEGNRVGERDGGSRVGHRAAADGALDSGKTAFLGGGDGLVVPRGAGVAPAERELSVRRPRAERRFVRVARLAEHGRGDRPVRLPVGPAAADDAHTRENHPDVPKRTRPVPTTMLRLPRPMLSRFERFSLYNSPYPAHDSGCAIDLYVAADDPVARSPVAGVVRETRTVRAPDKPYAHDDEYLILVDVDADATGLDWLGDPDDDPRDGLVARILHVDPGVDAGDEVAVGDSLGRLVRSGFFAPWVSNHVHVGFRAADANHHRARGSLPVSPDVTVSPLDWDGTGTVVETAETFVVLDAPTRADAAVAPDGFVGLASDEGVVLDGGLAHYGFGGALSPVEDGQSLSLLGERVGRAAGRDVPWADFDVLVDGVQITGLSLFASRVDFGSKLVCPGHGFATGDEVSVEIRPSADPIRLD